MVSRADLDRARGILSQHFLFWLNHWKEQLPSDVVTELRRAFYAGTASVIDTIDESDEDSTAAQALLIMKAEIHALADELGASAANDDGDGTPAA